MHFIPEDANHDNHAEAPDPLHSWRNWCGVNKEPSDLKFAVAPLLPRSAEYLAGGPRERQRSDPEETAVPAGCIRAPSFGLKRKSSAAV